MSGQTLNEIYELIEAENLEEARTLLQPLLDSDTENPDVWWLYAHAVEDEAKGQEAIQKVASLSPNYPGLAAIMSETGMTPARPNLPPPPGLPERPATPPRQVESIDSDVADDYSVDVEDMGEPEPEAEASRGLPIRLIAVLGVAVLLIGAILAILGGGGSSPTDDATQVDTTDEVVASESASAIDATEEIISTEVSATEAESETATATDEIVVETEEAPAEEAVVSTEDSDTMTTDAVDLSEALSEFDVVDNGINTVQTSVGETLVVSVCSPVGPRAATVLNDVMRIIAQQTIDETTLDSLAVSLTDCENDRALRSVSVTHEDAIQYADGTLTEREFQGRLRPIDLDTP